jgi:Zn-dependent membrane protease YugP
MAILIAGLMFQAAGLILAGIAVFGAVVFFQVVNLPVEFNASTRAKQQLVALGIVPQQDLWHVNRVLSAAAWTYVAATLQSILHLAYLLFRFAGHARSSEE